MPSVGFLLPALALAGGSKSAAIASRSSDSISILINTSSPSRYSRACTDCDSVAPSQSTVRLLSASYADDPVQIRCVHATAPARRECRGIPHVRNDATSAAKTQVRKSDDAPQRLGRRRLAMASAPWQAGGIPRRGGGE